MGGVSLRPQTDGRSTAELVWTPASGAAGESPADGWPLAAWAEPGEPVWAWSGAGLSRSEAGRGWLPPAPPGAAGCGEPCGAAAEAEQEEEEEEEGPRSGRAGSWSFGGGAGGGHIFMTASTASLSFRTPAEQRDNGG